MPKVSVIIPTFNRSDVIVNRALKSALAQNYEDYEVIVVDDASEDNTQGILKDYPIRYFRLDKNSGSSSAPRNKGIREAKGKYIVFVDDDNEILPNFLLKTTEVLDSNSDIKAVVTGRIIQQRGFEDYATPKITKFTSIDWGWLMRREVFDEILYDENIKGDEDTDFGIAFFKKYKVVVIDDYLQVAYDTEKGDDQRSNCFPSEARLRGLDYFLKKNIHEYRDDPDNLRYIYRLAGRNFYWGGYKVKGLRYFWKSFMAKKTIRSFLHFFVVLFGWSIYDRFMSLEERLIAKFR